MLKICIVIMRKFVNLSNYGNIGCEPIRNLLSNTIRRNKMKMSNIITIAIITISVSLLTGCEDGLKKDLTDCQLTNTSLQGEIEGQKEVIAKTAVTVQNSVSMISEIVLENEKLRREVLKLRKALEQKPKPQSKKTALTPEQLEKRKQDGLKRIFELQRQSAERMKKAAAEKNKK